MPGSYHEPQAQYSVGSDRRLGHRGALPVLAAAGELGEPMALDEGGRCRLAGRRVVQEPVDMTEPKSVRGIQQQPGPDPATAVRRVNFEGPDAGQTGVLGILHSGLEHVDLDEADAGALEIGRQPPSVDADTGSSTWVPASS